MARYRKPYILIPRNLKSGKIVYYYRLPGETVHHSTGKGSKGQAASYVEREVMPNLNQTDQTLGEYIEPFFTWDDCPHVRRLLDENKSITQRYVHDQRKRLEKHITSDHIGLTQK